MGRCELFFVAFGILQLSALIRGEFACKQTDGVTNFQKEKLIGHWYLMKRNPTIYHATLKCLVYNVTTLPSNKTAAYVHGENIYSDTPVKLELMLDHPKDAKVGEIHEHFVYKNTTVYLVLRIVDIEYDSYAIFHGCDQEAEIEYVWILTRERSIADDLYERFDGILKEKGVETKFLSRAPQSDCHN